jgi:aldehyde dehydrogenase (NAD+)
MDVRRICLNKYVQRSRYFLCPKGSSRRCSMHRSLELRELFFFFRIFTSGSNEQSLKNILLTLSPVIGAIAAGNCVVIKPGSYAYHSSDAMVRLIPKYMDSDCIVCIEGNRQITQAILAQRFDAMFFTGSPSVGKVVAEAAAKQLCPVVLELGGKSPCLITESVGSAFTVHGGTGGCVRIAARRVLWGALLNSGQTCVRPDTFYVHESVADEFINEMVAAIKDFYGGDTRNSPFYGRLVNDAAFQRLSKCLNDGKKYMVYGGATDAKERFIEPTIFDFGSDWDAFAQSELMQDEIFGPVSDVGGWIDRELTLFVSIADPNHSLFGLGSPGYTIH